jgi:hypothetical protein
MEDVDTERVTGAGAVIGVAWGLSVTGTFFSGIAFVGATFPWFAKLFFGISLAALVSATLLGVAIALFASIEKKST